jgi:hypothetical protein
MQPRQPGHGGRKQQVICQGVEPGATRRGGAEAAREVAVEEVGRAGQQQAESDHAAISGQRRRREGWNQQDPGARENVGHAP